MGNQCVHLVDDDEEIRRTLSYAVASGGYSTRVYANAEELLEALPGLPSGCIVTDVRMPGMDGLELLRRLRADGVEQPLIVMSGQADVALAVDAMKQGASDFLEKPFRPGALVDAVRAAFDRASAGPAAKTAEVTAFQAAVKTLTPRQRDVLEGVIDGVLNKTKAHELGISVRTLEGYRAEVMAKFGVRHASELVRLGTLARLHG